MAVFPILLLLLSTALAQAPPSTPCSVASLDCCVTTIEHTVIDGVVYSHQVCSARSTTACTPGCGCLGRCADASARCSCLSGTPTPTLSPSMSATGSVSPSYTTTPSQSGAMSMSMSMSMSISSMATPTPSKLPSGVNITNTTLVHRPGKHGNTHAGFITTIVLLSVCVCVGCLIIFSVVYYQWRMMRATSRARAEIDADAEALHPESF